MHRAAVTQARGHDDDNGSFNYPNNYTGKAHLAGSEKCARAPSTKRPTKQTNNNRVVASFQLDARLHSRRFACYVRCTNKSAYTSCFAFAGQILALLHSNFGRSEGRVAMGRGEKYFSIVV